MKRAQTGRNGLSEEVLCYLAGDASRSVASSVRKTHEARLHVGSKGALWMVNSVLWQTGNDHIKASSPSNWTPG